MSNEIIRIDLSQTAALQCKHCKGEVFIQVYFLRVIPALLSPTMKREIQPMPAFQCVKCRTLADINQKEPEKPQKKD